MNVIANQKSCEAMVSRRKGGNCPCPPEGTSVCACVLSAIGHSSDHAAGRRPHREDRVADPLEGEEQQECDQQRKDAERFRYREPEDEIAELTLRSRWIAQRCSEVVAENGPHADARAAHADAGDAGADILRGDWIHEKLLFEVC